MHQQTYLFYLLRWLLEVRSGLIDGAALNQHIQTRKLAMGIALWVYEVRKRVHIASMCALVNAGAQN